MIEAAKIILLSLVGVFAAGIILAAFVTISYYRQRP
tara:strand:+ start:173 stop:280 length:108 start_codon:yes stop_codon:yes gene_type:complete